MKGNGGKTTTNRGSALLPSNWSWAGASLPRFSWQRRRCQRHDQQSSIRGEKMKRQNAPRWIREEKLKIWKLWKRGRGFGKARWSGKGKRNSLYEERYVQLAFLRCGACRST